MTIDCRISAFASLGRFLKQFSKNPIKEENNRQDDKLSIKFYDDFNELIKSIHIYNPWFTEDNVRNALNEISIALEEKELVEWLSLYIKDLNKSKKSHKVAVIMAGNIPLVGFYDMLCVLLSGNTFLGKLSSEDKLLLPFISRILIDIEPEFENFIEFTDSQLKKMDAVIATGSNNSARYFDYYFGKYPNIIRKSRNSVAVLTGLETIDELHLLGKDVFQYFGLGCRNVSKLFVPKGYKFDSFYQSIFDFQNIVNNNKYANNYDYNRTVYLMASNPTLLDNNFLLLKEDATYSSPIGVLFFEYYNDLQSLNQKFEIEKENIQCIVANCSEVNNAIPFGKAQCPTLSDYADGIDTMKFLITLKV